MKKESRINREFFKMSLFLIIFFFSLLIIQDVFATDVAYVYKSKSKIDQNVLGVFSEMNLSVDNISEKDITKVDFSKYKFIYVGNERFTYYKKIPVDNYSSVISNRYFGYGWGLTDRDGISQRYSNGVMSIKKDGQIIQVYSKALYDKKTISVPYSYLGSKNKVPAMQTIASTYNGNNHSLGDVIGLVPAGSHLIDGLNAKGNICFYGITESKYWTSEARQLFKDCVKSVIVASNITNITCNRNSDCGSDISSNGYCINNSVYYNYIHYDCLNPGTAQSKCVSNTTKILDKNCNQNQICSNGACVNLTINITCTLNSDCGQNKSIGNNFCQNNDVFQSYIIYRCNNPGASNSYCTNSTINQSKLDCGNNSCGSFGANYCNGNMVYHNQTCYNPGCSNGSCFIGGYNNETLVQDCGSGKTCSNGACVNLTINITCFNDSQCDDSNAHTKDTCNNPGTPSSSCSHTPVTCFNNGDCGVSGYIGNNFCLGASVYQNYTSWICNNPGNISSYCTNSIAAIEKQNCSGFCISGNCSSGVHDVSLINFTNAVNNIKIIDDNNSNILLDNPVQLSCNKKYQFIIKLKNNGNFAENVTFIGSLGNLSVNHVAVSNLQPGNTTSEKVRTVNITGLSSGFYNISINAIITNDNNPMDNIATRIDQINCPNCTQDSNCGDDYCENFGASYCKGNGVYHNRTCHDKGCSLGNCFDNSNMDEQLVQDCVGTCINGVCAIINCSNNAECNDSNTHTQYQCINPGQTN